MRNLTRILLNSILTTLGILYPFALWFFPLDSLLPLFILLGVLWILRALMLRQREYVILGVLVCGVFLMYFIFKEKNWLYFYPIFINGALLFYFAYSLKGEALITQFARRKKPHLSDFIIVYTRNLTKIWCGFFIGNILVTLGLIGLEDKFYWSLYCGVISYILMGILLVGEIIFRMVFLRYKVET